MSTPNVDVDPRTAFMRDLRLTVNFLGVDGLVAHLQSPPDDSNLDLALLAKLAALLKLLAKEQELEYSRDAASEMSAGGANDEQPYSIVDETKEQPYAIVDETKDSDDVDSTYYNPTDDMEIGGDENVDGSTNEDLPTIEISKEAFPELFPTKEITKKRGLVKSMPNIDEFRGGIRLLSGGNFGWTFKSVLKGMPVVLKVSKTRSEEANQADYHEWSVSEKLKSHPNVLQIIGLCPSFENLFSGIGTTALITPLKENGGLREFFDNREKRPNDIMDMAFGMIAGIRSLHEQRAVHRDIAVRNFLVDCDGRVLLCDFGLTEFLPEESDVLHGPPGEVLPWRNLAPESFRRIFSTKSDIWTYGLALVELLSKQPPWPRVKNSADLRKSLEQKNITLPDMEGFPSIIAEIVRDCLQFDPSLRPSADDIAERLVKSQFERDIIYRDENGNTELHQIVINDDELQLELTLREDRARMINGVNIYGETPLMLAKSEKAQRVLLSYRKVPTCNSEPSRMPEYFHNLDMLGSFLKLAKNEDVEGIKSLGLLGLHHFKEQMRDEGAVWKGVTPLHVAAKTGNTVLLDVLISLNLFDELKMNSDAQTALHVAAIHGHTGVIDKLVGLQETLQSKEKVDVEASPKAAARHLVNAQDHAGKTALHLAAQYGNLSATDTLLRLRFTNVNIPDVNGQSPIFESLSGARTNRKTEVAVLQRFLDNPSVDINKIDDNGETVLHKMAREGYASAACILLQRKDVTITIREHEHGYTPLHLAVRELSAEIVKVLLSREDIDINGPDKYGNSPLHILAKSSILSGKMDTGLNPLKRQHGRYITSMFLARNDVEVNKYGASERTPLHEAAARNNTIVLQQLLAHPDIDVNIKSENDETPLHTAAKSGSVESTKLLLSRDEVDASARNNRQATPLHYAVRSGSVEVAKLLLSSDKVDANALNKIEETPLHLAAERNSVQVAKLLLLRDDVDTNARDWTQVTPLSKAAAKGSVEVAKLLLSRDTVDASARDEYQRTPLHRACEYGSVEIAELLLSRDNVNASARESGQQTPLHFAALYGRVEVAKLLLSRDDVDANARDYKQATPLHFTARTNQVEIAKLLLALENIESDAGDINQETPLHYAAFYSENDGRVTELLLARDDVNVKAPGKELKLPLHYAAETNNAEVAKLLLSRDNVNADARDEQHRTPLHRAAAYDGVGVAKLLLLRDDVDISARDRGQRTPLHYSAMSGSVEVAKLLLSRDDVDTDARDDEWQQTPLHCAAFAHREPGSVDVAKLLLSRDDVNASARDKVQRTPLHNAATVGNVGVAKLLLSRDDVDANAGDELQRTPLHYTALCFSGLLILTVGVAELLVARKDVDINSPDKDLKTPLHDAAEKNKPGVAKLILSRQDVDTEARDANGMTPLQIAAAKGNREVAKVLRATDEVDTNLDRNRSNFTVAL